VPYEMLRENSTKKITAVKSKDDGACDERDARG
jgi:hypothetical protein